MNASYRFGRFELRPSTRQLLVDNRVAALGARAFDVLHALVERRDRLVTKDELLNAVWPGLVVEENNLQVHISTLRKLLGAQAIATIPGRGYRFALELEDGESAPPPAPTTSPHQLPQPLTSFIGRERELTACTALLEQSRLLTLTGIGGSGKTRLALQLAETALATFPDGVWFVDLAPLKDAERLALSIATTLKLKEVADTSLLDTLCGHLSTKRTLLVLDNCEHLLAAVAELVPVLLAASREVKLLVTSREGLGIDGERLFAVRSLALPPAGATSAAIQASEAGQLFADRARFANARFSVDENTAPAIAEICRRLDGIPLALELAAARTQLLAVEEVRARLDDRFRLLAGGKKAALGRQETLRATLQWSYEQFDAEAQRLLRALSVFVGGWTLEGAMAVWGSRADEFTVLDLLTRLADKSLIETEWFESGPTRYAMLETVREFAQQLLQDAQEAEAARMQHLDYYLALAKEAQWNSVGPEQGKWQARLEREHGNLMAAHRWCDEAEDGAEKGLLLATRLFGYWIGGGLYALGMQVHLEALGRRGAECGTVARGRALRTAAHLAYFLGQNSVTCAYTEKSLALSRTLGDPTTTLYVLELPAAVVSAADPAKALRLHDEAMTIARELEDNRRLALILVNRGDTYRLMGDLHRAMADVAKGLASFREAGDLQNIMIALWSQAAIEIDLGNLDIAGLHLAEGIRLMVDASDKSIRQDGMDVAAALAMARGDATRAARTFGMADAFRDDVQVQRELLHDRFIQPWIAKTRAELGVAAFAAAAAEGRDLTHDVAIAETLGWLEQQETRR